MYVFMRCNFSYTSSRLPAGSVAGELHHKL